MPSVMKPEAHQMSLESRNNRGAEPLGLRRRLLGLETSKPCEKRERPGMTTAPVNTTAGSAGTECTGRLSEIRVESSRDGRENPTAGPSGASREAGRPMPAVPAHTCSVALSPVLATTGLVAGAVGAVHRSDEAANHRRAKGPHLVDVNCAAEDRRVTLPWDEILTPNKVRQLQRTLYRKAKENGRWRAWSL